MTHETQVKDLTLVIKSAALKTSQKDDIWLFALPVNIVEAFNTIEEKFTATAVQQLKLYFEFTKQDVTICYSDAEDAIEEALGTEHGTLTISDALFKEILYKAATQTDSKISLLEENMLLRQAVEQYGITTFGDVHKTETPYADTLEWAEEQIR